MIVLKKSYHWCCLRQMVSLARKTAPFNMLNIWRPFVGDLYCREAGFCLTANVDSLYSAIVSLHKTEHLCLQTKTSWGPTGSPHCTPRVLTFRQHCSWKCTCKASYTWHVFCSLDMRNHQSLLRGKWQVRNYLMMMEEEIKSTWDSTSLDKGC